MATLHSERIVIPRQQQQQKKEQEQDKQEGHDLILLT